MITYLSIIYTEDLAGGWTLSWAEKGDSRVHHKDFSDYDALHRFVNVLFTQGE